MPFDGTRHAGGMRGRDTRPDAGRGLDACVRRVKAAEALHFDTGWRLHAGLRIGDPAGDVEEPMRGRFSLLLIPALLMAGGADAQTLRERWAARMTKG